MPTTVISLRANECFALTNPVAGHHRYGDIWIVPVPALPLMWPGEVAASADAGK